MLKPLLEVIALDAEDARRVEGGGADRIELVSGMQTGGLSPAPGTVENVMAAVEIPVRVMVRRSDGFAAGDLAQLRAETRRLVRAGAQEFVLGFLDEAGAVDLPALHTVLEELDGRLWTFHKAIDHAADRGAVWRAIDGLPGLDYVLTSGGAFDTGTGTEILIKETSTGYRPKLLAGGGLRTIHLGRLRDGGISAFHTGSAVRVNGRWDAPIDVASVRHWRELLD